MRPDEFAMCNNVSINNATATPDRKRQNLYKCALTQILQEQQLCRKNNDNNWGGNKCRVNANKSKTLLQKPNK